MRKKLYDSNATTTRKMDERKLAYMPINIALNTKQLLNLK